LGAGNSECPTGASGTCGNGICDIPTETICSCPRDYIVGSRPASCGACTNNNGCACGKTCNTATGQCA